MAIGESSMAAKKKEIAAASASDRKNFPVGMRIVAVDDCKISLRLLSKLLTKCQYQGYVSSSFLFSFSFSFSFSIFNYKFLIQIGRSL